MVIRIIIPNAPITCRDEIIRECLCWGLSEAEAEGVIEGELVDE
jgi:hypothetical protein